MLLIATFVISGFSVSFGENEPIGYAESDDELVRAENQLNAQIAEIKEKAGKELDVLEKSKADDKEIKKKIAEQKENLKNLKSYKDFKSNIKVDDAEKSLKSKGNSLNANFAELCKEIEKYKEANPRLDTKEVVKHFNSLAGLKEKPKKEKLVSLSFGTSAYALSYSDWTELTTSEKILIALDPVAALITNSCKETAYSWTTAKFGNNGLGDKSDGFRHGIWNALMTRDIGRAWAEAYATAHQDKSQSVLQQKDSDGYYKWQHKIMDLHNNQESRDCVEWYDIWPFCSNDTLKSRVSAKLTNTSSNIFWLHN